MTESIPNPPYKKSFSLDRCDILENSAQVYPESYQKFQKSIEDIFFKSELLLKCHIEFERVININLPESLVIPESVNNDINLSLIFTGAIKSGRSSLINMLLNTKVMPTSVIGSSCCVNIIHPKSDNKQISVGVRDSEGWEVENYADLSITELPKKIESLQSALLTKSRDENKKDTKRIHVQLPHWLLKNINIYECPALDGMYSFDEPFDIIEKTENRILIHVIDASNGLMQWDRTFLAKIQYKYPQLPIFFVINHVDIQMDILVRDKGETFDFLSEKCKLDIIESESDHTSTEENISETCFSSGILNDSSLMKHQNYLIDKSKKQLKKLGFMLENKLTTRYASLSVKEFIKMLNFKEIEKNCYWDFVDDFFTKFNAYLSAWLHNLLVISSLDLKSRIHGLVDGVRCQILFPSEIVQDISSDTYLQDIKKAENKVREEFTEMKVELEKQLTKSVKEQLRKHEDIINSCPPDLKTDDNSKIIQISKPKLLAALEMILLYNTDGYNIDEEINRILEVLYQRLESEFVKIYKPNKMLTFIQYILNIFRALKITMISPLISSLPEEMIQTDSKWYKEIIKNAARKIRLVNVGQNSLGVEIINDIKITPIIENTYLALNNIHKKIQDFTKKYIETYKATRSKCILSNSISPQVFKRLLIVDFVIKVIEKSFQKQTDNLKVDDLNKLPTFFYEFFDDKKEMIKCISIKSFTSLSEDINILCIKRICRCSRFIMTYKSIRLLDKGTCLINYSKMDYDLLTAVQNETIWLKNDIIEIIKQLIDGVDCLMRYHRYLEIELWPENIMLKKERCGYHECLFFPSVSHISCMSSRNRIKRKFSSELSKMVYQIGTVLSWLLTNDIFICAMINSSISDELCPIQEFFQHISMRALESLKNSSLIHLAVNLLFKPEDYSSLQSIKKEIDCTKDS